MLSAGITHRDQAVAVDVHFLNESIKIILVVEIGGGLFRVGKVIGVEGHDACGIVGRGIDIDPIRTVLGRDIEVFAVGLDDIRLFDALDLLVGLAVRV